MKELNHKFDLMATSNPNGNLFSIKEEYKDELIKSHIAKSMEDMIEGVALEFYENNIKRIKKQMNKFKKYKN